jgi:alcohol dehydrogenase class IV
MLAMRPGGLGADCAAAIGGGSTIGLGKAIALDSGVDQKNWPCGHRGRQDRGAARRLPADLPEINLPQ